MECGSGQAGSPAEGIPGGGGEGLPRGSVQSRVLSSSHTAAKLGTSVVGKRQFMSQRNSFPSLRAPPCFLSPQMA